MSRDRWLAGIALTPSRGEGPFELTGDAASSRKQDEIESTLTAVYPHARFNLSDRMDARGLAGLGTGKGTIELQPQSTNPENKPIEIDEETPNWRIVGVMVGAMKPRRWENRAESIGLPVQALIGDGFNGPEHENWGA